MLAILTISKLRASLWPNVGQGDNQTILKIKSTRISYAIQKDWEQSDYVSYSFLSSFFFFFLILLESLSNGEEKPYASTSNASCEWRMA